MHTQPTNSVPGVLQVKESRAGPGNEPLLDYLPGSLNLNTFFPR